jgi:putative transposase
MTNHYHLLIETADGNLSIGMRQLNGVYTQLFNKCHGRTGHLFPFRVPNYVIRYPEVVNLWQFLFLNLFIFPENYNDKNGCGTCNYADD